MQEEQDGIIPVAATHRDPLPDAAEGDELFLFDSVGRDDFPGLGKGLAGRGGAGRTC